MVERMKRKRSEIDSYAVLSRFFLLLLIQQLVTFGSALSTLKTTTSSNLIARLQQCATPDQVLERVGRHLTPHIDPDHAVNGLVWTRLCKQLVALDNQRRYSQMEQQENEASTNNLLTCASNSKYTNRLSILSSLVDQMEYSQQASSALIDATKAASVVLRILNKDNHSLQHTDIILQNVCNTLLAFWKTTASTHELQHLQPNQLSGLVWALDGLCSISSHTEPIPPAIQIAYQSLALPFRIHPNSLRGTALQPLNRYKCTRCCRKWNFPSVTKPPFSRHRVSQSRNADKLRGKAIMVWAHFCIPARA